jgi:hypothetical protein
MQVIRIMIFSEHLGLLFSLSLPYKATIVGPALKGASELSCAVASLSTIVAGLTYFTATKLSKFRSSKLLSRTFRSTVADFAPSIGVLAGTWAAVVAKQKWAIALPSLAAPQAFGTTSGRPWVVGLGTTPVWARWAAVFPAIMASLLLFMDQVQNASCHNHFGCAFNCVVMRPLLIAAAGADDDDDMMMVVVVVVAGHNGPPRELTG